MKRERGIGAKKTFTKVIIDRGLRGGIRPTRRIVGTAIVTPKVTATTRKRKVTRRVIRKAAKRVKRKTKTKSIGAVSAAAHTKEMMAVDIIVIAAMNEIIGKTDGATIG